MRRGKLRGRLPRDLLDSWAPRTRLNGKTNRFRCPKRPTNHRSPFPPDLRNPQAGLYECGGITYGVVPHAISLTRGYLVHA